MDAPKIGCYRVSKSAAELRPARSERAWLDETNQHFAYRCIPMTIANASGWELINPVGFEAIWHGGTQKTDISLFFDTQLDPKEQIVSSHFGEGILTFQTGYVFRTPPGWALWVRGIPNESKRNVTALDGLVETDWLPFTFTMNWRFTRQGRIRFDAGEPFAFITPVPHAVLDQIEIDITDISNDPSLDESYQTWRQSRNDFNANLAKGDAPTIKQGWQRHYVRGIGQNGEEPAFHLSKRRMKTPIIK